MARQYKNSHKVYSAWNYQKEIEDLNKKSEQGWQLIHGGSFSSKFKRNSDVRYRYQLDFEREIEDMGRYIETFREQGWEYVNTTFNGWSYFRKLYDPSLPEEEYEIFTDRPSLQEMNGRWAKFASVLAIILSIFVVLEVVLCIQRLKLPSLLLAVVLAAELALILRGIIIMKNPDKQKNIRHDGMLLALFFGILIIGMVSSIVMMEMRPGNTTYSQNEYMGRC
jgi:hypothetical protein